MAGVMRTVAGMALAVVCTAATAQQAGWKPEQTVEISVGTAPGGGADRTARFIQKLIQDRKLLPNPIVVANKPGGGGTVGLRYLNQHMGNAHFLQMYSPNVLAGTIVGTVSVPHTDITPVATLYTEPMLVAVRTESPIKTGRELMERLKQDPRSLTITVGIGLGNMNHIGAALPMRAVGIDVRQVKAVVFNTVAESVTAVVGGHIDLVAATPSTILAQVQAGRLRALGIASPQRVPGVYANTPTWREQGIDVSASFWHAVIGPKGLTPAQTAFWENMIVQLAATDEWKEQLERNYLLPLLMKSAETEKFLAAQHAELKSVLTALGMAK